MLGALTKGVLTFISIILMKDQQQTHKFAADKVGGNVNCKEYTEGLQGNAGRQSECTWKWQVEYKMAVVASSTLVQ